MFVKSDCAAVLPVSTLVAKFTVTSAPGLPDRVTVNDTLLPSFAEASLTDNVAASLALIVPTPVASLIVMPPGNVPEIVTVNVSAPSARASCVVATVNVFVNPFPVAPEANVTLPVVFVKSDCAAVLPVSTLVAKFTVTSAPGVPDRVTVNDTLLPSAAEASFTDNVAASLALIVPTPVESLIVTPAGNVPEMVTVNVSAPSARVS